MSLLNHINSVLDGLSFRRLQTRDLTSVSEIMFHGVIIDDEIEGIVKDIRRQRTVSIAAVIDDWQH